MFKPYEHIIHANKKQNAFHERTKQGLQSITTEKKCVFDMQVEVFPHFFISINPTFNSSRASTPTPTLGVQLGLRSGKSSQSCAPLSKSHRREYQPTPFTSFVSLNLPLGQRPCASDAKGWGPSAWQQGSPWWWG